MEIIGTWSEWLGLATDEDKARYSAMDQNAKDAFTAWIENVASYADDEPGVAALMLDAFEECYQGMWPSEEDFAEDLARDAWCVPKRIMDSIEPYIDYAKFAHDLFMQDYASAENYEGTAVYVYCAN